jgi:hypothetical protein
MLARDGVRIGNIVFLLQQRKSVALLPFFIPVKTRFLKFMICHCRFVSPRDEREPLFRFNHLFRQGCFLLDHFHVGASIVDHVNGLVRQAVIFHQSA